MKILMMLAMVSVNLITIVIANDDLSLDSRLKSFHPVASKAQKKVRACYEYPAETIYRKAKAYQSYIHTNSVKYGVDEALIIAVITAESCFRQTARSPKSAQGLMQLIPATAERFGVKDAYSPEQNIRGGTRYLKFLLKRFSGNMVFAIAGYNAGEGAVDRYSGIPPYRETKEYVRRVMMVYKRLKASSPSHNTSQTNPAQAHHLCRDSDARKIRRSSKLIKRTKLWRRFYTVNKPMSLSTIARQTGVKLTDLLRLNRGISRLNVKVGRKVLIWECANKA